MFKRLRIQLTFWYVGTLAIALVVFSVGMYAMMARALRDRIDAGLRNVLDVTALSLQHEIAEHGSKSLGEERFREVLATMHQTAFPRQGIAVFEGTRTVAVKAGEGGLVPEQHALSEATFHTSGARRDAVRVLNVAGIGTTYQIVSAERLSAADVELAALRQTLFMTIPIMLLLVAVGGWYLARRSLRPAISMSEQLDAVLNQQRQFMADASHELRTPISVARTAAEVTLEARSPSPLDYRESLEVIQPQLKRLTRIVQDMFTLARADAGVYGVQQELCYLDEVIRDSVKAAAVLGARRGVTVDMPPTEEAPCHGDEGLLRQLVMILLDNGVKYTPAGGAVSAELERAPGEYRIRVSDNGAGIPPEAHAQIFRRFFRVDKARSRAAGVEGGSGAGLGLAIAQWIAHAHHGRIELTYSAPGCTIFTAVIPDGHSA